MLPVLTLTTIAGDDAGLRHALIGAGLPSPDTADEPARYFVLAGGGRPLAFGGVAGSGPDRLLRSVVVPGASRGTGLGSRIVAGIAEEARRSGAERLWLLTTDAAGFFDRLGWKATERSVAPDAIRQSRQFASICPASATLMVRELGT